MRRIVTMKLFCKLALVSRRGGVIEDFSKGSIKVGKVNKKLTPSEKPFIFIRWCSSSSFVAKYNLIGNIDDLSTEFLKRGRATVSLKQPSFDIIISKADPDKLKAFIVRLKKFLPKDSPTHVSVSASEPPIPRVNLNLDSQRKYKLWMEKILRRKTNLDQFTELEIFNCILKLVDYQLPIVRAIRKMKKLTTLRLERIKLRSLTFLEVKSKKLKRLHLSWCKTRFQVSSLFKNDMCYKDSLVELHLEGNAWSEIPNGIFQFGNLLKLSLGYNCFTKLPNKFANLPKLEELDLSSNQLTRLPSSIFKMQNLLKLLLSDNCLTKLPDKFLNLPNLEELLLGYNQLTHVPPSIFQIQNLIRLSLRDNQITELPNVSTNSSKLEILSLTHNQLRSLPPSIFALQNLLQLSLNRNGITELPDMFANLSKLQILSLSNNQLQYLPSSIFTFHLQSIDISFNEFNFEIPPSVDSEMIVHSLKELTYRAILNHKLIVKEGMLPKKFLKDLAKYRQCFCGRKFVDEGKDVLYFCNLTFTRCLGRPCLTVPVRGKICNSLKSCVHDRFTKRK